MKTKKPKVLICSICQHPIPPVGPESHPWIHGCNAQPVNNGRCCHECDATIVIPARIAMITKERKSCQ
jgi:hypothetical protein